MLKPHTLACHSIDVWGFVLLAAVTPKTFVPHIIGHDQDDVGRLLMFPNGNPGSIK